MNVKISYTVPFDRVASKVDELLMEAGRDLETAGHMLKPTSLDEEPTVTAFKLDLIVKARQKMLAIDLILEDCYTILASYNKALADMRMPRKEETNAGMADERGFSNSSAESGNSKT